jgi:hypothetical protein
MKLRSMGDELFHGDRRADMTKLIVAFRNFTNSPKTASYSTSQQETEQLYE